MNLSSEQVEAMNEESRREYDELRATRERIQQFEQLTGRTLEELGQIIRAGGMERVKQLLADDALTGSDVLCFEHPIPDEGPATLLFNPTLFPDGLRIKAMEE